MTFFSINNILTTTEKFITLHCVSKQCYNEKKINLHKSMVKLEIFIDHNDDDDHHHQ